MSTLLRIIIYAKIFTPNRFNKSFINISPRFQKEWVECINGKITVEQIFDITPRGLGIPRKVNICAEFYSTDPHPQGEIKSMFHSDFPID